ncbi:MAG: hypothetical protein ACI8UX_000079 [Psychromonas sp.]|jgi:uncharacterized protein YqeY
MSLKSTIDANIKVAMLAKDKIRLLALRDIKKVILIEESKPGASVDLSEATEMAILQKAVKQRRDSAAIFKDQNRPDLLEKEEAEIAIISEYLPEAMSEEDLKAAIQAVIIKVGATSLADIGKVMGTATKALAGKADGRAISTMVKVLLAGG